MTPFNSEGRHEKLAIVVYVLQNTYYLVISRCCFAKDGKEMYKNSKRTCRTIMFRHSLLKLYTEITLTTSVATQPPCFTTSYIFAQTISPSIIFEADGGWITFFHVYVIKEPVVILCFKSSKNDKIKFTTRRFEFHQMPILNFRQPATKANLNLLPY